MTDTTLEARLADRAPSYSAMLVRRVAATPDLVAFRYPDANENWVAMTWRQTKHTVFELAAGLLDLGLQFEDRVAIAGSTRIDWILADLAVSCAGGATTTIYPSTHDEDVAYIITDSGARIVVAENVAQVDKVLKHPELREQLLAIVLIDGTHDDDLIVTWDQLHARGKAYLAEHPNAVDEAIARTTPDMLATLIYTSGTTGRPKGVRLHHDVWAYEARAVEVMDIIDQNAEHLLWLPLSHVFGRVLLAAQLQIGFRAAVDGRLDRIVDNLGKLSPTFMCGAPRIFEKVRATVMRSTASGLKARISRWAFSVGKRRFALLQQHKPVPRTLAAQYAVADKLVFSKLKARLGGKLEFLISGSAKLSQQVQEWFFAAGIPVLEGYGLTETSAISFVNHPRTPRPGTVGPPVPGTECRIAEDGEILLKGPGVMRSYHNLPERTAEAFTEDGWFHTGDIGEVDADGYLRITDRKKDLIKTSGGKFVAPQKVEGAIVANCPYISQVVAYGEGRKYISALVTLDPDAMKGWAETHDQGKLKDLTYRELTEHPETRAMIQRWIDRGNERLERWETVKKFTILPEEFNLDAGEVTANMKIRRSRITNLYAKELDSMYEAEPE
ncbi:AMP-dependent synthetase/ligase [Granulicoccus phenolivorans]|uniref:AMP-dependent synthetase/ligase n=1 Tax=Granulicoccus phenolivorans TaxID=266854 RepID=UPI00040C3E56|nr:long-chain fatty acid--CoA ligase [Granulicoccus phenolivorans]